MSYIKPNIIVIHETITKSIATDAVTLLVAFAIMGVASWLGHTAFQWVGALVFLATVFQAVSRHHRYSLDEAYEELDRLKSQILNEGEAGE